jgi:membrane protease YdiL (CAAX protease family)
MEKTKKNILILVISILCIAGITSLAGLVGYISSSVLQNAAKICLNLLNGLVAVIAMRLTGMKPEIDFKNRRQYLTGIVIGLVLGLAIAVIPSMFGLMLVGPHIDFSWGVLIYKFFFYMLVVGPVEELIFRVYLQDAFISFFNKNKWAGVILSSLIFGFWHIINGNIIQVMFAFCLGLVFGFSKYRLKNCGYVGVAVGHGLYDFICALTTMLFG